MRLRLIVMGVMMMAAAGVGSAADLPLTDVVLYTSGVGFFQHQGLVHGDQTVTMAFRVDQVNDILKSMVLQDLSGGTIGPVTYAPRDPLERTLRSFAVDIGDEPSLGTLLSRLRGAEVKMVTTSAGTVTGTVLGTEWQEKSVGENVLRFEVVNLVTVSGLKQIPIWHIESVELVSEELSGDLTKALAAIAANRDVSRRQVELHFNGAGARTVSVGYLLETPVWKTSYRLVADEGESFLQGWAIVENTTDEDWEGVRLALVSGRPISFTQDLYEPIYVPRPDVPVSVPIAAAPKRYEGALEEAVEAEAAPGEDRRAMMRGMAPPAPMMAAPMATAGGFGGTMVAADALAGTGVAAAAAGAEVGEMFHYAINQPITIDRQGSAMIPIVNQAIETEKLSIYNPRDNSKYPLHGLRIKNTTGLALMGGAITVFEGGAYAGDALIDDLGAGDERLVSYAADLGLEVSPEQKGGDRLQEGMKIVRGVLYVTLKETAAVEYTIKSRADAARTVLLEHPRREDWELVEPAQAQETTRTLYRIEVEVPAGETVKQMVREQHQLTERVVLTSEAMDRIAIYVRAQNVPEAVKQALGRVVEMKQAIAALDQQIADREARLEQIGEEQERIRQNMEQLDHDSDLYRRYVAKFSEQEDEFDKIRTEIEGLKQERNTKQQELENYLANLNVE